MVVRTARAELERHARVEARIAVAERNTEAEQAVLIRLVERADRTRIRIAVMAIAKSELRLVVRIELLHRMQCRQSIAARRRTADVVLDVVVLHVHIAVDLLIAGCRDAIDIAHICRTVRIVCIADNTRDHTARLVALFVLAADIDLCGRAIATNLDGITCSIRVDEVARRLEFRIQNRQVLADALAALDVRAILVHMNFFIERITGNQVAIAFGDSTVVIGRNRIGLVARLFVRCFIHLNAVASLDLDSIL